jgi:hypothetical protein
MAEEMEVGCARPTGGVVGEQPSETPVPATQSEKEKKSMIQVGKKAPDFVAPAYHKGKFVSVKLSEYLGKWVLLCFYPGDFTFV